MAFCNATCHGTPPAHEVTLAAQPADTDPSLGCPTCAGEWFHQCLPASGSGGSGVFELLEGRACLLLAGRGTCTGGVIQILLSQASSQASRSRTRPEARSSRRQTRLLMQPAGPPLPAGPVPQPSSGPAAGTTCSGTTRLVLYPDQALTQPQALEFCKAKHGAAAGIPAAGLVAAVQQLVQQAKVWTMVCQQPLARATRTRCH